MGRIRGMAAPDGDRLGTLTEDEALGLAMALGRGQASFAEDQYVAVCTWANEAKVNHRLLRMVLDGQLNVSLDTSGAVVVSLPEMGRVA